MCDARSMWWPRRDVLHGSWPATFSSGARWMTLLSANGGGGRSAHRPTWGDPRGGQLTAGSVPPENDGRRLCPGFEGPAE